MIMNWNKFVAGYTSLAKTQLSKYNQLKTDDLKELCEKNNVNLIELKNINNAVDKLFMKTFEATKNLYTVKKNKHCLGDSLQGELQKGMNIVKRCIAGNITLSDRSIQININRSERKLCAFLKICKIEIMYFFNIY